MNRSFLTAGLVALAILAASPGARADGPSKHVCVEASEAGQGLQQAGKLRDARAKLAVCIAQSCPGPVREDCAARLSDIDKAMPSIVFEFTDANGAAVPTVAVNLDGAPIAELGAGKPIDVDPGEHVFRFEAPGQGPLERKLVIRAGERSRQERVAFAPTSPTVVPSPVQRPEVSTGTAPTGSTGGGGPMRALAFVAGGVGVVGLGVGIGIGVAATSKHSTLESECPGSVCPSTANGDLDAFHSLRTVSTVGYTLGALGLVGGGVLFFLSRQGKTGSSSASVRPWLGLGSAGVSGSFR
jgi:hypothetical protein